MLKILPLSTKSKKMNESNQLLSKLIFFVVGIFCFTPLIDPPLALLLGLILAQTTGHPYISFNKMATNWLLKISIVALGFGMNLNHAIEAGKEGLIFTIFSIFTTLILGYFIGKFLKVDLKTSYLISSGTAICGGSAISAVSPIIKADDKQLSVALGIVFILNSIGLFIFPIIGGWFQMSQHQFGVWAAIAIHDTSSVVGAASKFGQEALQVATTIKLERALWIIPLSVLTIFIFKGENKKITIPYFIIWFILAMIISTSLPQFKNEFSYIVQIAKKGLTLTLFLIGTGLSLNTIKSVGLKPFIHGILLWIFISILSFIVVLGY